MKHDTPPRRYDGLQDFLTTLEKRGRLKRITRPVALKHEITEIHRRVLQKGGPVLYFEQPVNDRGDISPIPLVANLFGTRERIEWGFGLKSGEIDKLAALLSALKSPHPPASFREAMGSLPLLRSALSLGSKTQSRAPSQAIIWRGADADLNRLPVQWCWPGEPAPLVTWPLVITRDHDNPNDINVGIYRMQVLDGHRLIMRWLSQRGGAKHFRSWKAAGKDMPVTIAIGADPATILSAVMPLPEGMSELDFAGVLNGQKTRIAIGVTQPLPVPANAEIVLEGSVSATEEADEGPYGDHTGYFNAVERFPVVTLSAITMRKKPVYLSTYTGRPPDEPSVLGEAMNELFIPLVKQQFSEVTDIYLPPEACSYRAIVIAIDKRYPGQARRVMMGLWSMLSQFNMTKLIIVVDGDINVRDWKDVIWALSTRFDAARDTMMIENTPIDYLDFASPKAGLGGKLGLDATTKIGTETEREWGETLKMSPDVSQRIDNVWQELGLD